MKIMNLNLWIYVHKDINIIISIVGVDIDEAVYKLKQINFQASQYKLIKVIPLNEIINQNANRDFDSILKIHLNQSY